MQTVTTIGLDITKSVFQVHGVDANGQVVIRRQLKRRYILAFFQKVPPCRSDAMVSNNCCKSSLIKATNDCPRLHGHVLPLSAPNCRP